MVIIRPKKFILRPFKNGDERPLKESINDKTIYRNTLSIPYPYTLKDAREWVVKTQKQTKIKNPVNINFAISIGKEVIGGIGFSHIDKHKAEIGYWLSKKHREKGIMTEAVKLTAKFGFGKLKLKRIYAYVFLFNKASKRVLEKAGYKLEGTLRKYAKKGNKFMDVLLFAKTK